MIKRLMRVGMSVLVYFCVATILAQSILLAHFTLRWSLTRSKLVQILAIVQGVDIFAIRDAAQRDRDKVSPEQVSYQQIRETRAVKVRYLELREQAVRRGLAQLATEQRKLADDLTQLKQLRQAFQKELAGLQQSALAAGRENARLKLESLKPKQAKAQLVEMLNNDEMDEVVVLLAAMPDAKAAKIMTEFKLPEENEQLYQILRRIREGYPDSKLVAETQSQLSQSNPTGP